MQCKHKVAWSQQRGSKLKTDPRTVDRSTGAVLSNSGPIHKHGSKSWSAPLLDTPQMAPLQVLQGPRLSLRKLNCSPYSFVYPERMRGSVGLVCWPRADGLPTLVVTRQLRVERRTWKVHRSKTNVLPLCHAAKPSRPILKRTETCRTSLQVICIVECGSKTRLYWVECGSVNYSLCDSATMGDAALQRRDNWRHPTDISCTCRSFRWWTTQFSRHNAGRPLSPTNNGLSFVALKLTHHGRTDFCRRGKRCKSVTWLLQR